MNQDNFYWLFSAAAQSIAAMIAFLMAGIALAFAMMDRLVEQDDTLTDVVDHLRRHQHSQLKTLAYATAAAILVSLLAVYLNPFEATIRTITRVVAVILDVSVIVGSTAFVVSISRPDRYSRAAQAEYLRSRGAYQTIPGEEAAGVFFHQFVQLEQMLRSMMEAQNYPVPTIDYRPRALSFRQMVEALHQYERISPELRDLLLRVSRNRNLIFHGHMERVDEGVIQELASAVRQLTEANRNQ